MPKMKHNKNILLRSKFINECITLCYATYTADISVEILVDSICSTVYTPKCSIQYHNTRTLRVCRQYRTQHTTKHWS